MSAVFRREWKQLFVSWRGYVFLALTAMMTGLFTLVYNFYFGYNGFEYPLNFLCVAVALLVPMLTLSMFSEERKTGVGHFVATLPVSDRALVMGKYLALLAFLAVVSLCMGLVPILLGLYGTVSYATAFSGLLAFFCIITVMMTVELFVSLMIRRRWLAVCIGYLIPVALVALGYLSSYLPEWPGEAVRYGSIFGGYMPFLYGLFDARSLVLWLSVALLFLLLLIWFADRARTCRKGKEATR